MQAELSAMSHTNTVTKGLSSPSTKAAKLPKLVISRFGGSFIDWPKFWGHLVHALVYPNSDSYAFSGIIFVTFRKQAYGSKKD